MDAQSYLTALGPAMTDADTRERFLADPKAVLAAAGLDLPESFTVSAREGDVAELAITLPPMLKPDADLTEEQLNDIIDIVRESKIDGVIATNTTIAREALVTSKSELDAIGAGVEEISGAIVEIFDRVGTPSGWRSWAWRHSQAGPP